jgi:hypothetical protein
MKRLVLASLALLGLLAVLLVMPAFSSSSSPSANVPRQIRQLNAKMRALQSRVTLLEKSVSGIKSCTSTVQALTRFNGYVWSDGVTYYTTTAVDVPDTGEGVGAYFVLADPRCVTGGSSRLFSLAKPAKAVDRAARGERLNGLAHPDAAAKPSSRPAVKMSPREMSLR